MILTAWSLRRKDRDRKQVPIEVITARVTFRTVSFIALNKTFSGTLPQWLFLQGFQSVTERKKKGRAWITRIHGIKWDGEITCGHNPWLRARLVDNPIIGTMRMVEKQRRGPTPTCHEGSARGYAADKVGEETAGPARRPGKCHVDEIVRKKSDLQPI